MRRYVIAIVEGPATQREVDVDAPLEVGREPEEGLTLEGDEQVSRRHARLTPAEGGLLVTDLGSRNGTYVNGRRLAQPELARAGDRIVIGETTLEVRAAVPQPEPVPERSPTPPAEWVLTLVRGEAAEREIVLDGSLEIGRDPSSDLVLDDEQASRRHARLAVGEEGVLVEDLGSKNGTVVNGRRIRVPTMLEPGDRIVIGETALELGRGRDRSTKLSPAVSAGSAARPMWTFVITSAALFMAVLDNLVVTFALPEIQVDFGASVQALEWTVNAFTLSFAVFLLTGATLGDRFGRKRMLTVGLVLFSASSAVCALAPNVETLLAGRAAQGIGAALIMPLTLTIVSAAFPGEKRGLALGAWSGIAGLAIALGPLVGGAIVTALSWQWIFWINVPIGAVIAPLAILRLSESFGRQNRLDLVGAGLASGGLFGIVYAIVRGGAVAWTAGEVLLALAAGAVLMIAFIAWELRAAFPMVSMHLFRNRTFSAANCVSLLMYFGMFGTFFLLAQFLQVAQGYSALEAGLRSLPWTGVPIFVAPLAGILAGRLGARNLIAAGLALQAVALVWLALIFAPDVSFGALLFPFLIGGTGMSLFFAPTTIVILGAVRPEEEGQASGVSNALRQLGTVLGVTVMGTIFAASGSFASPQAFTDGVVPATWVGAAALGSAFLLTLVIPRRRPAEPRGELAKSVPALGGMTPVTSQHAIVSASQPVPQWELHSVPLSEADHFDPGEWEPFAVAQDRLYLRRPASRLAGMTGVESKVLSS